VGEQDDGASGSGSDSGSGSEAGLNEDGDVDMREDGSKSSVLRDPNDMSAFKLDKYDEEESAGIGASSSSRHASRLLCNLARANAFD